MASTNTTAHSSLWAAASVHRSLRSPVSPRLSPTYQAPAMTQGANSRSTLQAVCESAILKLMQNHILGLDDDFGHITATYQAQYQTTGPIRLPPDVACRMFQTLIERRVMNMNVLLCFVGMNMEELNLSLMHGWVNDSWMCVLSTMSLKRIDLSNCNNVSNEGIVQLCLGEPCPLCSGSQHAQSQYLAQSISSSASQSLSSSIPGLSSSYLSSRRTCVICSDKSPSGTTSLQKSLTHLNLSGISQLSSTALENLGCMMALESLNLNGCDKLTNIAVAEIARNVPGLKSLNLEKCERISGAGLECISVLTQLEELVLSGCSRLSGESIRPLTNLKHCLRTLSLRGCVKLNGVALEYISEISSLKSLDLNGCHRLDDHGFIHLAKLHQLEFLCLTDTRISDIALVTIAPSLGRSVKRIHLTRCSRLRASGLGLALAHFKVLNAVRLRSLAAMDSDVLESLCLNQGLLSTLEELDLTDCKNITDDSVLAMVTRLFLNGWSTTSSEDQEPSRGPVKRFVALKKLFLKGTNVTGIGISSMVAEMLELEMLDISGCPLVDSQCMKKVAESATKIQTLTINSSPDLSNDALLHLHSLQSLKTLSIESCANLTNSGMMHVANLSSLTELNVAFTSISDAGLSLLVRLRSMRILNLKGLTGITALGVQSICKSLVRLENLNLSGCRNICDAACRSLESLSCLHRLSLHNCTEVSDTGVRSLVNTSPRLYSLNLRGCRRLSESLLCELTDLYHLQLSSDYIAPDPDRKGAGIMIRAGANNSTGFNSSATNTAGLYRMSSQGESSSSVSLLMQDSTQFFLDEEAFLMEQINLGNDSGSAPGSSNRSRRRRRRDRDRDRDRDRPLALSFPGSPF